jgi:hypothetical protein
MTARLPAAIEALQRWKQQLFAEYDGADGDRKQAIMLLIREADEAIGRCSAKRGPKPEDRDLGHF